MVASIAEVGLHRAQNRVFIQVIANQSGDIGVNRFVVGDAGSRSISQRDVAGAVGAHESGHAQCGVGTEGKRVKEVVIHAAVNDVDALEAVDGLHVNHDAIDDQVASFDQFDAHLLRQKAVLEIRAVVNAGSEQHDLRFAFSAWRQHAQDAGKFRRVVVHGEHFMPLKSLGESAGHDQPILENIRDATGSPDIVFQNEELASLGIANQIDATNMGVDAVRDFEANHLAPEMPAGVDERGRNLAVFENELFPV